MRRKDVIYIQVSDRKYNYTSDNAPYRSTNSTYRWYHSHYYSAAYSSDSKRWSAGLSSYSKEKPTLQDVGNGYYDQYASGIRQQVNGRDSDGGGMHSGK